MFTETKKIYTQSKDFHLRRLYSLFRKFGTNCQKHESWENASTLFRVT